LGEAASSSSGTGSGLVSVISGETFSMRFQWLGKSCGFSETDFEFKMKANENFVF
jgi:hypothetical protein